MNDECKLREAMRRTAADFAASLSKQIKRDRARMIVFVDLLKKLMVSEMGYTEQEAESLCKKHRRVVIEGIMSAGTVSQFARYIRPTAMAIEMAEDAQEAGGQSEPA